MNHIIFAIFVVSKLNKKNNIITKPIRYSYSELSQKYNELYENYYELIMAVGNCFEGESRHETALRYIREKETNADTGCVEDIKQ